ncbi:hypothetical protein P7C70_g8000, partial [Phenoliferia sp. Uapishka_3]
MQSKEIKLDLGYVSLAGPEHDLKELGTEKLSEVLIPGPLDHILIYIRYCLGSPTKFKLRPDSPSLGLTREEIIRGVVHMYNQKYRIHMHELGDLILSTGYYGPVSHEMTLGIDS